MDTFYKHVFGNHDILKGDTPTEKKYSIDKEDGTTIVSEITGFDRLKNKILRDEYGELSNEVMTILDVTFLSSFLGAIYGGVKQSRIGYIQFFETNQATAFKNHIDAKRKLHDAVVRSFIRGGIKWCWRLTLFTSTYFTISTGISVYRDKNGVIEHTVAGAMAGSTYRFNMGPRGWLVGGLLGATLGTFGGLVTMGALYLTNSDIHQVRENNKRLHELRFNTKVKESMADSFLEDKSGLNKAYEKRHALDQELLNLGNVGSNAS